MKKKPDIHVWHGYTQTLRVMKLMALLLIIVLQVRADGYTQTVTFSANNKSLFEVLKTITQQTKINFTYNQKLLEQSHPITVELKGATISEALKKVLEGQSLKYEIINDRVIVILSKIPAEDKNLEQLPSDTSKNGDIKIKVLNMRGEPLPGATVLAKGLNKGSQANASGEAFLAEVDINEVVTISYTGYKSQVIKISGYSTVVYLEPAVTELDKVVVQGYGVTTQRFSTGNISTVSAEEIERQPVQNVLQALQGKVAGLTISQTSGYASAPFKVEIRGRTTISTDFPSEPLIIVDGVPLTVISGGANSGNYETGSTGFIQNGFDSPAKGQSPLYSINPDDIESISVLKDADATAIYGSRGGRGVILITTKKGKPGKTILDANVSHGVSFVKNYYDMLSTPEYVAMRYEAFKNNNISPDASNAYDLLIWDTTRQTNWQKVFWGKAGQSSNYKISVSGGDKNNNYRISGGYDRVTALNTFSGFDERASVLFNMGHKNLNNRLSIELSGLYTFTKSNNISLGGGTTTPPNAPAIFNETGKLNYAGWEPVPYQFIFGTLLQPYVAKTRFLNSNLRVEYRVLKGLTISTSLGYSNNNMVQNFKIPIASQNPTDQPLGSSSFGNNNGTRVIVEPMVEYQTHLWKGNFNGIVGGTYQTTNQDGGMVVGEGYTNDNLLGTISNAVSKNATDNTGEYKYAALFSRLSYNVLEKYILTLSGRRDGSSRFGPGKQFGNFGAIGVAWIFSEEPFIKDNIPFLSFGKIRGSYGLTGSDLIGDYNYLTRWTSNNFRYFGSAAYAPLGHANPDLQWQVDKKLELALNLGFLNDRISANLVWYRNRSSNQLLNFKLPFATGFSSVTANFPATVQNMGWEPGLTIQVIKNKNVELTLNAVVGINRNKLLAFPDIENSSYATTYEVGKTLNLKKILILKGVDPATGQYVYEDINKDGQISTSSGPDDDRVFKDVTMKYDGGFGFDLRVKNWQLSSNFNVRSAMGINALYSNGWPGSNNNIPREALNRWQKPGDITSFARYTIYPEESDLNFTYSNGKYTNASFIRLSNLYIAYNLPKEIQRRIHFKGLKIYARGQNLLLFSRYKGSDPEVQVFGALPPLTSIDGGIQLTL